MASTKEIIQEARLGRIVPLSKKVGLFLFDALLIVLLLFVGTFAVLSIMDNGKTGDQTTSWQRGRTITLAVMTGVLFIFTVAFVRKVKRTSVVVKADDDRKGFTEQINWMPKAPIGMQG